MEIYLLSSSCILVDHFGHCVLHHYEWVNHIGPCATLRAITIESNDELFTTIRIMFPVALSIQICLNLGCVGRKLILLYMTPNDLEK